MTLPSVNPSARVQRIPVPIASPGQCGICGSTTDELGYADARLDFEFYGTLIFCSQCTGDLAGVFGYVSPAGISALREQVEAQNDELNTLRQAILGLESAVDGLTSYDAMRSRGFGSGSSISVATSPEAVLAEPVVTVSDAEIPERVSPELVDDGAVEDESVNEPADEQGRDDVRDLTKPESFNIDELL